MGTDHGLRLVDLLAARELGLRMLTDADPDTPIAGAHAIEIERPQRWLEPGWLMLTTGSRFSGPGSADESLRALVRQLHEAGIAGLAFGVGVCLPAVPRALVDEARRRGFPVLSVPLEVPFLRIESFVHEATRTSDVRALKRTVSFQDYLLESLAAEHAEGALVGRLAELLRGTVVLYDDAGTVLASSGVGPLRLIRDEIISHPATGRRFTVGRWHVRTDPVRTGYLRHWLAIAARRKEISDELADPALEAARRLVAMIVRSREAIRAEDRLRRTELVRMLIGAASAEANYLWDRLAAHRFRPHGEIRLLLLATPDMAEQSDPRQAEPPATPEKPASGAPLEPAAQLAKAAAELDLPLVVAVHEGRLVAVVEAGWTPLSRWLERLPPGMCCGASEAYTDLSQGAARFREATLACTAALRGGEPVRRFEDVGLVDWLVAGRTTSQSRDKADQVLEPVLDNPMLAEALAEYFRSACDIRRTARRLALHPNSVRYRLRRVGELLGRDLREPATVAELYLALRLSSARDPGSAGEPQRSPGRPSGPVPPGPPRPGPDR